MTILYPFEIRNYLSGCQQNDTKKYKAMNSAVHKVTHFTCTRFVKQHFTTKIESNLNIRTKSHFVKITNTKEFHKKIIKRYDNFECYSNDGYYLIDCINKITKKLEPILVIWRVNSDTIDTCVIGLGSVTDQYAHSLQQMQETMGILIDGFDFDNPISFLDNFNLINF